MPKPPETMDDPILRLKIEHIIREHQIGIIVETGSYLGEATKYFASLGRVVITIEIDPTYLKMTNLNLSGNAIYNVLCCLGNSPMVLWLLAGMLPQQTLFFLDAHWEHYWPVLDEIRRITPGKGIIVVHDMKVPDRPDLGFDSYGGQDLDYDYLKPALLEWSSTHRVEYNTESEAGRRGTAFIYPR